MKFLHGRGRYQKKTLTADMIHDERYGIKSPAISGVLELFTVL